MNINQELKEKIIEKWLLTKPGKILLAKAMKTTFKKYYYYICC